MSLLNLEQIRATGYILSHTKHVTDPSASITMPPPLVVLLFYHRFVPYTQIQEQGAAYYLHTINISHHQQGQHGGTSSEASAVRTLSSLLQLFTDHQN